MLGEIIGLAGATGEVFELPASGQKKVFKRYFPESYQPLGSSHVERLISWRSNLSEHEQDFLDARFAWPSEVFVSGPNVVGFTMPRAPAHFAVYAFGRNRLRTIGHLRSPDPALGTQDASELDLARTVAQFAESLRFLWHRGANYRDVSDQNILWTPTSADTRMPALFFIDCDSCDIPNSSPPVEIAGSRGWLEISGDKRDPALSLALFHTRVRRRHEGPIEQFSSTAAQRESPIDQLASSLAAGDTRSTRFEDLEDAAAQELVALREDSVATQEHPLSLVSIVIAVTFVAIVLTLIWVW